jgi:ribonuclease D
LSSAVVSASTASRGGTAARRAQAVDKAEQVSDWARRPLSPAQLAYGALDAVCLLRVLGAMDRMDQQR